MDIGSGKAYPANALSNFHPYQFIFDGVNCSSMEGLLQAFKFDKHHIQIEVCKLVGFGAKKRGFGRNKQWRQAQTLWWKGITYGRHSDDYQRLLTQAYDALFENESFKKALAATQKAVLTHSIGRSNESETILTEREFCGQLTRLRNKL